MNFHYSKINNFYNVFSNTEKNESLHVKKFVELSKHLYLLTSIPKETFSKPFISICLPLYNVAKYLPRLIRSFQNQNFKNYELILVDDASSDNSEKIIKIFQKFDKRIKYIKSQYNRGTAYSRSLGIENARGEYITFFDPDDLAANFNIIESIYKIYKEFDTNYILTDLLLEENSRLVLTDNHYFSPSNVVIYEDEYRHGIFENDNKKFFGGVYYEVINLNNSFLFYTRNIHF